MYFHLLFCAIDILSVCDLQTCLLLPVEFEAIKHITLLYESFTYGENKESREHLYFLGALFLEPLFSVRKNGL